MSSRIFRLPAFYSSTRVILKRINQPSGPIQLSRCTDEVLKSLKDGQILELCNKIRQHVNPLAERYQVPVNITQENILSHLNEPKKNPVVVDVGCAKGNWDILMAAAQPHLNFLGLEIRVPAVHLCLKKKLDSNLKNVHFMYSNANVDLGNILKHFSDNNVKVDSINVQFPDPQFKKRLYKRRVVNPTFVAMIARHTAPGTRLFVQSDIREVEEDMVQHISASRYFTAAAGYNVNTLDRNESPHPIQTEREIGTLTNGGDVYRMLYVRNDLPFDPSDTVVDAGIIGDSNMSYQDEQ